MKKVCFLFSFLCFVTLSTVAKELIEIKTDRLSLIYSAEPGKEVKFNYFGERLQDPSPFLEAHTYSKPDTREPFDFAAYATYGNRQFNEPALKISHADGSQTAELIFVETEKVKLSDNVEQIKIKMKDKIYPFYVTLTIKAYQKENILSQSVSIHHREKGDVSIESFYSFYLPVNANQYYLSHFHGTWSKEMQRAETLLTPGIKSIESKKGVRTTQAESPSFILGINKPAQETNGEIIMGTLAWSGNFKLNFEVDEANALTLTAGENPFGARYILAAKDSLKTPEFLFTYSKKGIGEGSRNFHRWGRTYGMTHGDQLNEIVLNSWEGAYFSFDETTITQMMDNAAQIGVETFVLDDGWFGNKYPRNADNAGLGDWQINEKKLPRGIDYLASYATSKGLKFGIWIEPEMVNPESDLAHKHPEWIVKSPGREIPQLRNQWLLDLSNPKVQEFVYQVFANTIALSPHISYIKWDANRHVESMGSTFLNNDRQQHFWHSYVNGLYTVYEKIRKNYPDIVIQLCSSGGGRLDYGALRFHDEFWASDNTDPLSRVFIQYGSNLFYPAMATAAHVSPSPSHQTTRQTPLKFRFDVAMSGRLGIELEPKFLNGSEKEFIKQAIDTYKEIRPLVQKGDLFTLHSPYDPGDWFSRMFVDETKSKGVLFAYSLDFHQRTIRPTFKLQGLDPNKKYMIREINRRKGRSSFDGDGRSFRGDFLMNQGITLNIQAPYESAVFSIEAQ